MVWRVPSMDDIFLEKAVHHNSKTLLQKKATEKWYRTIYFNNLTERPAWRNSRLLAAGFRVAETAAKKIAELPRARPRQKKNAPGEPEALGKNPETSEENERCYGLAAGG